MPNSSSSAGVLAGGAGLSGSASEPGCGYTGAAAGVAGEGGADVTGVAAELARDPAAFAGGAVTPARRSTASGGWGDAAGAPPGATISASQRGQRHLCPA
jgi:hypothetical protein